MIEIEVNDEAVLAALQRAGAGASDLFPLMQGIGEYLVESTKQRFKDGKAPDGSVWAAKSPATIAAYERRNEKVDLRPLFGPRGLLSSQIASRPDSEGVSVGSSLNYSAVMQFGAEAGAFGTAANDTPIPWGKIPARPYLGISDADREEILHLVDTWLDGLITPV